MYNILGTDISHWQGQPSFDKMKEHGIQFLYAKAGEYLKGNLYPEWEDDEYARNRAEAKRVGIPFGAYYYFHPAVGASDQARHFLNIVNKYDKPELPLVIDIEVDDNRSPAQVANVLYSFITYLEQRGWQDRIIIYTRNGFWVNQVGHPSWGENYPFWIAQYPRTDIIKEPYKYTTKPSGLSEGVHRLIWQFTERMQLPGLPNMDGNWWTGTEIEWDEFIKPVGDTTPEYPPQFVPIDVEITANFLRYRTSPIFYSPPTMIVEKGEILKAIDKVYSSGIWWYKVELPEKYGTGTAYISAENGYTRRV